MQKTWAAWKTKFNEAHKRRKRLLKATGCGGPFGAANTATCNVNATIEAALNNLANAATNNNTTIITLVASNRQLAASLAALLAKLEAALAKPGAPPLTTPTTPTTTPSTTAQNLKRYAKDGYCWSHGYRVCKNHTSATCTNKKEGHKDLVTQADTMGGKLYNLGWETK